MVLSFWEAARHRLHLPGAQSSGGVFGRKWPTRNAARSSAAIEQGGGTLRGDGI
jgi:hypothetical protein